MSFSMSKIVTYCGIEINAQLLVEGWISSGEALERRSEPTSFFGPAMGCIRNAEG